MMRAIVQKKYGSIEGLEIQQVVRPVPAQDEVLVRVYAASLHPDIWHVVTGKPYVLRLMGAGLLKPKNMIPGTDMAGVVESVGSSVAKFKSGDAVFGETIKAHQWTNGGALAEYVCVKEEWLAHKPENVSFAQAASVPSSGFIALQNLRDIDRLQPGKHVLVNGAGGGVGSLAVQIAKAHGAIVTAVDYGNKSNLLSSLGVDYFIDCNIENYTQSDNRYDLIFDIPGNYPPSVCKKVLKDNGKYILIGHQNFGQSGKQVLGLIPDFIKIMRLARTESQFKASQKHMPDRKETLRELSRLLESGKLNPPIDSCYPLEQIKSAFRHMMEEQIFGKVMIQLVENK